MESSLQQYAIALTHQESVTPPDRKQFELTEKILLPRIDDVMENLSIIREGVDNIIKRSLKKNPLPKPQDGEKPPETNISPTKYPIGYCHVIRDYVLSVVKANERNQRLRGVQTLVEFHKRGGIVKAVQGIQHRKYFQNGTQAGALWIDVANDTVDPAKPKVVHSWLETSGFQNADDPTLCAEVIESYWQQEVFPNTHFPELATLFPFFTIDSNGVITIVPSTTGLIGTAILSDLETTEHFLFSSRFSEKQLPKEFAELIGRFFYFTEENPLRSFHQTGASREELEQVFARHRTMIEDGSFREFTGQAREQTSTFNDLSIRLKEKIFRRIRAREL